jgi:ribosomal protein L37AE/L43A
MKFKSKRPVMKFQRKVYQPALALIYPGLYCPRCGSQDIGVEKIITDSAIWNCRECMAEFKLVVPRQGRF